MGVICLFRISTANNFSLKISAAGEHFSLRELFVPGRAFHCNTEARSTLSLHSYRDKMETLERRQSQAKWQECFTSGEALQCWNEPQVSNVNRKHLGNPKLVFSQWDKGQYLYTWLDSVDPRQRNSRNRSNKLALLQPWVNTASWVVYKHSSTRPSAVIGTECWDSLSAIQCICLTLCC